MLVFLFPTSAVCLKLNRANLLSQSEALMKSQGKDSCSLYSLLLWSSFDSTERRRRGCGSGCDDGVRRSRAAAAAASACAARNPGLDDVRCLRSLIDLVLVNSRSSSSRHLVHFCPLSTLLRARIIIAYLPPLSAVNHSFFAPSSRRRMRFFADFRN